MNMQEHILMALREQFNQWEALLASLNDEQITAPLLPSDWSIKDVIAHLMAWQKRSVARVEAALFNREPEFPERIPGIDPDTENNVDRANAWIYAAYRDQDWANVQQGWSKGFLRFLEKGEWIPERDLLDSDKYPWMEGYPLANVFLSSYDHHQEHLEKLLAWMREREGGENQG